ncbi:MAG: hypothetical protein ACK491_03370, partial [Pseudanabaena sp.]
MRYFLLWFLSFMFAMMSLSLPKPARSQSNSPSQYPDNSDNHSRNPSSGGFNPLILLNLINSLSRSGNNDQQQVDLSPDIAEIRGQIGRLYFLLARQYAAQNQLPQAC